MPKSFKYLHIISFDVPLPANYGGVIDVFYKIKTLQANDVRVILHCFHNNRSPDERLKNYCHKVYYYKRKNLLSSYLSTTPLIVKSRENKQLVKILNQDNYPILFEGLHTTLPLYKKTLNNKRLIIVRMHNVEHSYYSGLAKSEYNWFKKLYFYSEAFKLKKYEKVLHNSSYILPISRFETDYFKQHFNTKIVYLPPFHENNELKKQHISKGDFALFHGDLRVADNVKSIYFLIDVFKTLNYPLIIAGQNLPNRLQKIITKYHNIKFVNIGRGDDILNKLFEDAHINLIISYQKTGIKLKLINALFKSKFILANDCIAKGTGLEPCLHLANTIDEFRLQITKLSEKTYKDLDHKSKALTLKSLDNNTNARVIIKLLSNDLK